MAWSATIDTIIESARNIDRSYFFEVRNGYSTVEEDSYTRFSVRASGWEKVVSEGNPPIATLKLNIALDDFTFFEEFNHANQMQKFAHCRLQCVIYNRSSVAAGAGTITLTSGSRDVVGVGTAFLTELSIGSIIKVGEFAAVVRNVVDNLNLELFDVMFQTLAGTAYDIIDDEREYIFRGFVEDSQQSNMNLSVVAYDPLYKLKSSKCFLDMESTQLGPYTYAQMRWASFFDEGGPEEYSFEVDPTAPGQAWAEDIFGNNRSFVNGVFEVVDDSAAVPPGVLVTPSEYMIDAPFGIIRFHNDQAGSGLTYYIRDLYVYQEGTLELADVVEALLRYDANCTGDPDDPGLGPGIEDSQLEIPLTGTFTLTNGAVFVGGVATAFTTELSVGDRIALDGVPEDKGIVTSIASDILLTLKYPFKGATAGPGTGFKSTLREAGISISNILWKPCDGTCGDLLRYLREYYADSRGYRIWYDPFDDYVRGDLVEIDTTSAIQLGPKTELRISNSTDNFGSAVCTSGTIGRSKNLITDAACTLTGLPQILPLVGANPWLLGIATGGLTTWGGLSWPIAEPPPAVNNVNDTDLFTAFMCYRNINSGDPDLPLEENYYQYVHIDLGSEYDIAQIEVYAANVKNVSNFQYGVSVHKSAAFAGAPVADLGPIVPQAFQRSMGDNEHLSFDCAGSGKTRYLLVKMRPVKWVVDGGSRSLGLREIIIFGSSDLCRCVCIQSVTCPGRIQAQAGTVTFNAGGPPYMVTGVGTNFGGPVATTPQVGDSIALGADRLNYGFIEEILSPTSARLVLPYPGVPGAAGAYNRALWPSVDTARPTVCIEGEGGHFIGGSSNDLDFIVDYYPKLMAKMYNTTHRTISDDSGLVFSEPQALDRAYIILNEVIRLYREIFWQGSFDPRIQLYDTVQCTDEYRQTGNEELYFLVEAITQDDSRTVITGREYGAGVLE